MAIHSHEKSHEYKPSGPSGSGRSGRNIGDILEDAAGAVMDFLTSWKD